MSTAKGRTYRRCACRDDQGRQLGAQCPQLSKSKHGSWYFSVDVPSPDGGRRTDRRGGFALKGDAQVELDAVLERYRRGVREDHHLKLSEFLQQWLAEQRRRLKPSTLRSYERYVGADIVPALGWVRVQSLYPEHVEQLVRELEADGRGPVTIRRVHATLSSALAWGVKRGKLLHNPAAHVELPAVESEERQPWDALQIVTFLAQAEAEGEPFLPLFELLAGSGLRRGEGLALRWRDLDLDMRTVTIRANYTAGGVLGSPKTKASAATVGISRRVVNALRRHAEATGADVDGDGLVFPAEDGGPIRPERVLRHLRSVTRRAGLPEITVHDLRHSCATMMLAQGYSLAKVSKQMRHASYSITVDRYGHMQQETSVEVADGVGDLLDAAQAEASAMARARAALPTQQGEKADVMGRAS